MTHPQITDGPNDRPREAPVGQSAAGHPVAVDEAEAARIAAALGVPANESGDDESEAHPS